MDSQNMPDKNMLKLPSIFKKKQNIPFTTSGHQEVTHVSSPSKSTVGKSPEKTTGFFSAPAQIIKRSVSDLNELSHTSAVKLNTSYDIKSDDEKEYSVESQEINKLVKCMVYITCENAGKIKKLLQEQVTKYNTEHKEKFEKIAEVEKCVKENLVELKDELTVLTNDIEKAKKALDERRNKMRVETISCKIPAHINIKGIHDKFEALVVKIHPKNASFDIEYIDENKKNKSFSGIYFNQLCIVDDKNTYEKATSCDLKGGAKKSKKSKKVMKGGSMEDSISTDSLC